MTTQWISFVLACLCTASAVAMMKQGAPEDLESVLYGALSSVSMGLITFCVHSEVATRQWLDRLERGSVVGPTQRPRK